MEYIDTKATPEEIQKYLSLCGPSVESVTKTKDDYIYDIEITSNRIDTASVYGIAREACAILNRFTIKTILKPLRITEPEKILKEKELLLKITDSNQLCKRLIAIVMDNVQLTASPQYIQDRLQAAGIRSINNVVDVTNYVMTEIGIPTHVFDYDRIKSHSLIVRKAKKDEEIITLDEKKYTLNENDIIIDDGTGTIIDFPGIMGTANSVVTPETKRIIFFLETNDPIAIRKSSMKYGIRTVAATINEKSPDPETAKLAFLHGIELFQKLTHAKVAGNLIDIYPKPQTKKTVSISIEDIDRLIGVHIPKEESISILENLGFKITLLKDDREDVIQAEIPSYRVHEVSIKEDLIEEIARIYGYFNLPNNLPPMVYVKRSREMEKIFVYQNNIKLFLKHLGLHEVLNYSMISEKMINDLGLTIKDHLYLSNTLSEDIKYLRTSLIPSLMKNIKDNQGKKDVLKLFELSKTYIPRKSELPNEVLKITIAVNTSFIDLKGIVEGLMKDLHMDGIRYSVSSIQYFNSKIQAEIACNDNCKLGYLGQIKQKYTLNYGIKGDVFIAELDFQNIIDQAKTFPTYKSLSQYALIKLDLTIDISSKKTYQNIIEKSLETSKLLEKIDYLGLYKNKISLRYYFTSNDRNITEEEAKKELEKIKASI
ncbi:MAG: phenylalanine--tRNA ligase subunit beta [bacterium]|nr:phenylalanine--tRNA ligase subunit beta [bacterium]